MICEKCVHNEVCKYGENRSNGLYCTGEKCRHFKPKSRFVELPCEVGQTVWIIDEVEDDFYAEPYPLDVKVLKILITQNGIALDLDLPLGMRLYTWAVVGENVFLSREEAEKALAERSK